MEPNQYLKSNICCLDPDTWKVILKEEMAFVHLIHSCAVRLSSNDHHTNNWINHSCQLAKDSVGSFIMTRPKHDTSINQFLQVAVGLTSNWSMHGMLFQRVICSSKTRDYLPLGQFDWSIQASKGPTLVCVWCSFRSWNVITCLTVSLTHSSVS